MTPSQRVSAVFAEQFEQQPDLLVRAPGRVNLIGEHTDYNDGFVLPCAIDYETCVAIGLRGDNLVEVIAADYDNQRDRFSLDQPIEHHPSQRWSDYIRGVVKHLQARGHALRGLNLVVSGNVPQGTGSPPPLPWRWPSARPSRRPRAGHQPGGNRPQRPAGGEPVRRLQLRHHGSDDLRERQTGSRPAARLPFPGDPLIPMPTDLAVLIVNSNVRRGLVDSEYNTRRQQCETAARHYGVKALRILTGHAGSGQGRSGRGLLSPCPPRGRRERPHPGGGRCAGTGRSGAPRRADGPVPRRHAR